LTQPETQRTSIVVIDLVACSGNILRVHEIYYFDSPLINTLNLIVLLVSLRPSGVFRQYENH
jgi:hypothetical protein